MSSPALTKFSDRMLEVKRLHAICTPEDADYRIKKENSSRDSSLLRGAHVLLCSHIEGFFEDLVEDLINAYDKLSSTTSMIPDVLRAYQIMGSANDWGTKTVEKRWIQLKSMALHPLLVDSGMKPSKCMDHEVHIHGFANPGSGEVRDLFKTVGIIDVWDAFKSIEPSPLIKDSLDAIVNRRNQIAHGKVDATITLGDSELYVFRTERLASVFDTVITFELNTRLEVGNCWQTQMLSD